MDDSRYGLLIESHVFLFRQQMKIHTTGVSIVISSHNNSNPQAKHPITKLPRARILYESPFGTDP